MIWNGSAWTSSTDFGANNLVTTGGYISNSATGFIRLGLAPGSGAGSAASAGQIRLPNGGNVYGRNAADTLDIRLIAWSPAGGDVLRIGSAVVAEKPANVEIFAAGGMTFHLPAEVWQVSSTGGVLQSSSGVYRFNDSVSAPQFGQAILAGTGTGQTFLIFSQSVNTGTGGILKLQTGAGSVASGNFQVFLGATMFVEYSTAGGANYQANNIVTTGDVSIGTTPSTAGDLRVNHGFSLQGRNQANSADRTVVSWGVAANNAAQFGDAGATFPNVVADLGNTRIDMRISTTSHMRMSANVLDFNPGIANFDIRSGGQALFGLAQATTVRNLAIFAAASTSFQSGDRVIFIADRTAAPAGNPTGGAYMYCSAGAGTWRGSSGTTTTFGPAEPHCPKCKRDFAWQWENDKYGHLSICAWCLSEQIEALGIPAEKFAMVKRDKHQHAAAKSQRHAER